MKRRQNDLFKLPNSIFSAHLTPIQYKVIAALYSLRSRTISNGKKYVKISQKSLKKMCGVKSTQTISDAVNALCRLGYIHRIDRYYDDYKKLGTYVYTLPVVSGRDFFFVSRRFFKYMLTAAQTRMYLFFCKCADSTSKWFWNSYNDIRDALRLKRSAVIQTVKELCSMGLIRKRSVRKKDGSQSDNHYKVVTLKPPRIKIRQKKGRSCLALNFFPKRKNVKLFYSNILNHKTRIVKCICVYFLSNFAQPLAMPPMLTHSPDRRFNRQPRAPNSARGSPKICGSLYSTHFSTNRKKKREKLYAKYRCNLGQLDFFANERRSASTRRISTHKGKFCSNQRTQRVRPPPRR